MHLQHFELSVVYFIQVGTVCAVLLTSVVGLIVIKMDCRYAAYE